MTADLRAENAKLSAQVAALMKSAEEETK